MQIAWNMRTLDIDECAEFLKINRITASEMAAAGKLPGAKIGRAWVFLMEDLVEYLKAQVRLQQRQRMADAEIQVGLDASVAHHQRQKPIVSGHPLAGRKQTKRALPNLDQYDQAPAASPKQP